MEPGAGSETSESAARAPATLGLGGQAELARLEAARWNSVEWQLGPVRESCDSVLAGMRPAFFLGARPCVTMLTLTRDMLSTFHRSDRNVTNSMCPTWS
jgi:hypothetical protein